MRPRSDGELTEYFPVPTHPSFGRRLCLRAQTSSKELLALAAMVLRGRPKLGRVRIPRLE